MPVIARAASGARSIVRDVARVIRRVTRPAPAAAEAGSARAASEVRVTPRRKQRSPAQSVDVTTQSGAPSVDGVESVNPVAPAPSTPTATTSSGAGPGPSGG